MNFKIDLLDQNKNEPNVESPVKLISKDQKNTLKAHNSKAEVRFLDCSFNSFRDNVNLFSNFLDDSNADSCNRLCHLLKDPSHINKKTEEVHLTNKSGVRAGKIFSNVIDKKLLEEYKDGIREADVRNLPEAEIGTLVDRKLFRAFFMYAVTKPQKPSENPVDYFVIFLLDPYHMVLPSSRNHQNNKRFNRTKKQQKRNKNIENTESIEEEYMIASKYNMSIRQFVDKEKVKCISPQQL